MSHFIDTIWGPWSAGILRAGWHGAAAVAVAWAICRWSPIPAALKCWVWRAVYLKLILALIWVGPVELPVWRANSSGQIAVSVAPLQTESTSAANAIRDIQARAPTLGFHETQPRSDLRAVLLGLWLAGVLACVGQVCRRWSEARKDRLGCEKLDDDVLLGAYQRVARLCRVARPPPLATCTRGGSPRLVGLINPLIVLPAPLLETARRPELELLLAHELAHYKRHDLWWALLALLGRVLFWFHPAVWFAERQWRLSEEIACDHAALAALGAPAGAYGRMLLDVAAQFGRRARSPVSVGVVESAKTLQRRLIAMRSITVWSARRGMSVGSVLAFLTIVAIVPWRLVAQQPERGENRPQAPRDDAAAGGPLSRPAIHPPLHNHQGSLKDSADRHELWLHDNVLVGDIECPGIRVASRAPGIVREIHCTEGLRVKKGDLLFVLDDARARASVDEAEAQYKKADVTYERTVEAKRQKTVAPSEADLAAADRDVAAARLAIAKAELDETRIVSPITGVVTRCLPAAGLVVNSGLGLADIVDVDSLSVAFDADGVQYPHLRVGQKVRLFREKHSHPSLLASINFLSPTVDSSSERLHVKATVEDADHLLKPGMTVKVDLQLYREEDLPH